jgi:epoxyqueuosine reductase QueG
MAFDPLSALVELLAADPGSCFDDPAGQPMYDAPVIGVAAAADPWFARFQEIIGPFYWEPQQVLAMAAPGAIARSVICWSLPISSTARLANRRETLVPARTWAFVRTFGAEVITRLSQGLVARLKSLGFAAVAPAILPENVWIEDPRVGIATSWSERHTAFVAGLGTFGLSGGLITQHGIAHRLGSVVTDAPLTPTSRPYGDDPFAWCLQLARGECGACISRCPAGSIGETSADRDKFACAHHYGNTVKVRCEPVFGWKGIYGCGLCQTDVPCEDCNPVESAK